jgi:hypothetical protein
MENNYLKLAAIDVTKWVEQKGPHKLDYLSWPHAVDLLMSEDPAATWVFHEPQFFWDTVMVSCTVTAFGKPVTMHLPVMNNKNEAVKEPDAFLVNKAMMRCLVKAIACHGLGIKVYSGEDLPSDESIDPEKYKAYEAAYLPKLRESALAGKEALKAAHAALPDSAYKTQFFKVHGEALKAAAGAIK